MAHFSLASPIVGNNWKPQPKTPPTPSHPTPPTPSLTRGPISTIWDQGGPRQTPQTAIHTPAMAHFSLASPIMGNNWKPQPKTPPTPSHPTPPTPSLTRGPISTIWDQGGPRRTPQTAIHTPAIAHFSLASPIEGNNWKPQPKTPPTPSHPSPGVPYQPSGTRGGPVRPPKQPYIPLQWPIFPYHLQSWVTTGIFSLKPHP